MRPTFMQSFRFLTPTNAEISLRTDELTDERTDARRLNSCTAATKNSQDLKHIVRSRRTKHADQMKHIHFH